MNILLNKSQQSKIFDQSQIIYQSQTFDQSQIFDQSQMFEQVELPTLMTLFDNVDDKEEESKVYIS